MPKSMYLSSILLLAMVLLAACQKQQSTTPTVVEQINPTASRVVTIEALASPTTEATEQADIYLPFTVFGTRVTPTRTSPETPTTFATPTAVAQEPTATPTPSPPPFPAYDGPPLPRGEFGMQVHLHRESLEHILNHLQHLNVGWVKVQVSWKLYEPKPGDYDEGRFRELDHLVSGATGRDIQVLLSVAKAPEWSRSTTEFDGPPLDSARFQQFMQYLAQRYQGNVAAYELWNEPNLQREWYGAPLSAEAFVKLVRHGAAGVRAGDEQAVIVSGAPATTGVNDGVTAIDDRVYLQGMLAQSIGEIVDAVGVHPYGWANPPDASVSKPDPVAPSHNNHSSFFFADTIREYRTLLDQAGFEQVPLWVTEFGWGSFDGMGSPPPPGAEFMAYVSEWQQAVYTLRAYQMAHEWTTVGPMFLWNLNFAPTLGNQFSESGYSVLRPSGAPRPVYYSLQTIPRQ